MLALPLFIGFWLWADTASYDLRNLLGLLLIGASIPLYALLRRLPVNIGCSTTTRNGTCLTPLSPAARCLGCGAHTDFGARRYPTERAVRKPISCALAPGFELNQNTSENCCSADGDFSARMVILPPISALRPCSRSNAILLFTEPLNDALVHRFTETTGCTSIFYPPRTYPPIHLAFYSGLCRGARPQASDRKQRHGGARIEPMTQPAQAQGNLRITTQLLRQNQRP